MLFELSGVYLAKSNKQTTPPKNLFSNRNKLAVILSISLQLYNHYKYMIIFIKMQRQNTPKKPNREKENKWRSPHKGWFQSEQPAEGAHAPTRAGCGQAPPKLTSDKVWPKFELGGGGERREIILSVALMKQACSL